MAHFEKFQAPAIGNMCAHYERRPELELGYERENIDPERTHLNYNLAPERGDQVAFINERIASLNLARAPRKDAVRMVDCIVTMPKTLNHELRDEFFQAAYDALESKFGPENVISAYVHLDEVQPHMHFGWVPVTQDGRLSAKAVLSRNMLQRFHPWLQAEVEQQLGCKCEICLDEESRRLRNERQAKYVDLEEFKQATARLEEVRQETRCVEEEIKQLQPAAQTLSESLRTLSDGRGLEEREAGLRSEVEGLRERVSAAEQRVESLRYEVEYKQGALARLRERLEYVRGRLTQAIERMGAVPITLSRAALAIAKSLGKQTYNPRDYQLRPQARQMHHSHDMGLGL